MMYLVLADRLAQGQRYVDYRVSQGYERRAFKIVLPGGNAFGYRTVAVIQLTYGVGPREIGMLTTLSLRRLTQPSQVVDAVLAARLLGKAGWGIGVRSYLNGVQDADWLEAWAYHPLVTLPGFPDGRGR